jgi:acyl-coenzyme A synthetase/AMP-(fatty) acid ligase
MAPGTAGILSDLPGIPGLPWREVQASGAGLPMPGPLAGGTVEFWTSGSTGEPKCIQKPIARLDSEVETLEGAFGHLLEGGVFLGTVPHNHIYGCLFRILWPLATGRPFLVDSCWEPTRLVAALESLDHPVLVSSPSLLARLEPFLGLDRLRNPVQTVFSSGGALPRAAALACRAWAPGGVNEVYGSTESGGIAWRNQDAGSASDLWTPFPDAAIAFQEDGALVVRSPRTGHADLRMEDAARPAAGGRFSLLGRLDRIVKVGEKRVSLPEVESALESHPWVAQASVVPLEGTRLVLGAVVILTPGHSRTEKKSLVAALRAHLARTTDPLALPRKWRFPKEMPACAGGKTTQKALADLFASADS